MSERATKIIAQFEGEMAKKATFNNLYQKTADLVYPRENQITALGTPGEEKTDKLVDTTAVMASQEMASGLSQNLVPPGQPFFALEAMDSEINKLDQVKRYLSQITVITHEHLFKSNFLMQLNETLRSLSVFGTGCLFSSYDLGLNFLDYDIANYVILENSKRRVDQIFVKFVYTASQAFERWGDKAGKSVIEAMSDSKGSSKPFEFLHYVAPRGVGNPLLSDKLNMPFASFYIGLKDKNEIEEGGFEEFPYHVVRWSKSSNEVWGRGQGTFALPDVRMLQWMKADLIECADKLNNPPLEVLETHEGEVRVHSGAINYVLQANTIKAIQRDALGNFPISKDILLMQQEIVKNLFFNDVFKGMTDLKGDRRTTLEIQLKYGEGLKRLGPPIGRINEELFTPLINRNVLLLDRNGRFPEPPPEIVEQELKVEYIGRLSLELKSHQAKAAQQWVGDIVGMAEVFPEALDIVNVDSTVKLLGTTRGVNVENINSDEVIAEKRKARAEQLAQQRAMEMAQQMGQTYKDVSGAVEEGSPAAELQEAVSG